MPRLKDTYCVCTYLENANTRNYVGPPLKRVVDSMAFEATATERCLERKEILEKEGKKSVKAYVLKELT